MRITAVRLSRTGYRWLRFNDPVHLNTFGGIVKRQHRKTDRRRRRWSQEAIDAMADARRKVPLEDHQSITDEYVSTDVSYAEIGDRYGVRGETIRLIVKEVDPAARDKRKALKAQVQGAREWKRVWRAMRVALAENRVCKTCGGWVLRGRSNTTCSPECADAYTKLRTFDDPDYHRRAMAKGYLRSPDKYAEVQLDWARRMLGPNPPKRNRTYLVPGSERAEVIKKYRPELYEELVSE